MRNTERRNDHRRTIESKIPDTIASQVRRAAVADRSTSARDRPA